MGTRKSRKNMAVPSKGAGELLLMRHGERVDRVFPGWIRKSFDAQGRYVPFDLNLPASIPTREPAKYRNDGPITEVGTAVSKLVGRGLRLNSHTLHAVYSSPALRCVQTAAYVLRYAEISDDAQKRIRVEPGLFESMGWYESTPSFMSTQDLLKAGYPVATDYKPVLGLEDLVKLTKETNAAFHERAVRVLTRLSQAHSDAESIFIVGHAPTVDIGGRLFTGEEREGRDRAELDQLGNIYPFGGLLSLRRPPGSSDPYKARADVVPPLTATRLSSLPDLAFLNR